MTGLELLKAPGTTAEEIADIISAPCPPVVPTECDRLSCRECWLAWLTTGTAAKEKGPSDEQTAPDEDGLHPNLIEYLRREKRTQRKNRLILNRLAQHKPESPCPHTPPDDEAGTP